ncbi:hypothetical protein D3C81_894850 [compost metagenome]
MPGFAILHRDGLYAFFQRAVFPLIEVLFRIFWVQFQLVYVDIITSPPGTSPTDVAVVAELHHRIAERTVSHRVITRAM